MGTGTLILITGASRGIGRACAVAFAQKKHLLPSPLRLCIVARSQDGLRKTDELVRSATADCSKVELNRYDVDLSDLDTVEGMTDIFQELQSFSFGDGKATETGDMAQDDKGCYERAILINNAGSLGHLGPSTDLSSLSDLRKVIDLNVTSSIWLSSNFIRQFRKPTTKCTVVNISSLCAIEPFKTMGTYCAGKAAREMFHTVLAKELSEDGGSSINDNDEGKDDDPNDVKILNYAPGVVNTEMTETLSQNEALDDELSQFFREIPREGGGTGSGQMLMPSDTAKQLVDLVVSDKFQSGSHVDYWDLVDKV